MSEHSLSTADKSLLRPVLLVADDSDAFRKQLAALIRDQSDVPEVLEAANMQEVLDVLKQTCPCAVLIDVHLARYGAQRLLHEINKACPDTVLVALTYFANPFIVKIYRCYGADHCFDKSTELESAIRIATHCFPDARLTTLE